MVTEEMIWEQLRRVMDPELNINVVDLGLIYEVRITKYESGSRKQEKSSQNSEDRIRKTEEISLIPDTDLVEVDILMTLTSPGCPLAGMFDDLIGVPIRRMDGVHRCRIEITFDPPWDMSKMSEEARAELGFF
jgi:metal-sulfur cluster biosynthetic enzyme